MVRINEGSSYSSGCSAVQTLSSADRVGSEHKLSSACIALVQSEGYVGRNGYSNEVSEYIPYGGLLEPILVRLYSGLFSDHRSPFL